jgi:hypothetical protein
MIDAIEKLQSLVDPLHMKDGPALASVPAPSGAEPVAVPSLEKYDFVAPREFLLLASYCGDDTPGCSDERPCTECLAMCNIYDADGKYLRQLGSPVAPQAVPAEDVAGLIKRLRAVADPSNRTVGPSRRICSEAVAALTASEAEATSLRRWLGELLAVIHRDGGHHQDFAGTEQAVADAQSAVVLLFQAQDERNDLRMKLEEAEQQRDENAEHARLSDANLRDVNNSRRANLERAEAAERKLEEYRKALEPFAAAEGHFDGHVRDEDTIDIALRHIRAHHVRAAARTLSEREGQNG